MTISCVLGLRGGNRFGFCRCIGSSRAIAIVKQVDVLEVEEYGGRTNTDSEWEKLFKFQKEYRSNNKLTIKELLKEFNIPETLKHHLSSHKTSPTNNPDCKGYQLRVILRDKMANHLRHFSSSATSSAAATLTTIEPTKPVIPTTKSTKSKERSALIPTNVSEPIKKGRRRPVAKAADTTKSQTAKSKRTSQKKLVPLPIPTSTAESKALMTVGHSLATVKTDTHRELVTVDSGVTDRRRELVTLDTGVTFEHHTSTSAVAVTSVKTTALTPVRHVLVKGAVVAHTVRLTNSSNRPLRFRYICDKKERLLKSFTASFSFVGIALGGGMVMEDSSNVTSSVTLSPLQHMDVTVQKYLHLSVTECAPYESHPPLYTHHKVSACNEVIMMEEAGNRSSAVSAVSAVATSVETKKTAKLASPNPSSGSSSSSSKGGGGAGSAGGAKKRQELSMFETLFPALV